MIRRLNDRVTASPQISATDVEAIKEQGFTSIVAARNDGEMPGQPLASEIEAAAKAVGLEFAHIPVTHGAPPTREEAEAFAALTKEGPVFGYCGAGPRVIFLASLAAVTEGRGVEEVMTEAAEAGIDLSGAEGLLRAFAEPKA